MNDSVRLAAVMVEPAGTLPATSNASTERCFTPPPVCPQKIASPAPLLVVSVEKSVLSLTGSRTTTSPGAGAASSITTAATHGALGLQRFMAFPSCGLGAGPANHYS